jgi:hypothetical protein
MPIKSFFNQSINQSDSGIFFSTIINLVADTKETIIIASVTTRPLQDHQVEQGQVHTSDSDIFFSTIVSLVADTKETIIIASVTTRPLQDHQDEQGQAHTSDSGILYLH